MASVKKMVSNEIPNLNAFFSITICKLILDLKNQGSYLDSIFGLSLSRILTLLKFCVLCY